MKESRAHWMDFLVPSILVAWCSVYIARASFLAVDGKRYFSIVDDSLISLRYAWNFAHGQGLQWNTGGDVEGYSNLLMVLLMSVPSFFMSRRLAVLGVRVEGMLLLLLIGFLCAQLAERLLRPSGIPPRLSRRVGFLCGVSYYSLNALTLEGMETGLLTALLIATLILLFRSDFGSKQAIAVGVLLGLAFATRPDGLVLLPFALVYLAIRFHKKTTLPMHLARVLASMVLIVGIVTLQRWIQYGHLVPNTYDLKILDIPFLARIKNGLLVTLPYLSYAGPLFAVVLVDQVKRPNLERLICFGFALSLVGYHVWVGGDYTFLQLGLWRLPAPGIPVLLILLVSSAHAGLTRFFSSNRPSREMLSVASVLLIMIALLNRDAIGETLLLRGLPMGNAEALTNEAVLLSEILKDDARIAVSHAGTVPYYTGLVAIDLLGKNDRHVARMPPSFRSDGTYASGHNKVDLRYSLLTLAPDSTETIAIAGDDLAKLSSTQPFRQYDYRGYSLWLRTGSKAIRWSKLQPNS